MGLAETINVGFPKVFWDVLWLPYIGNGYFVRGAFLSIYKLEIVTIGYGYPPEMVDVVRGEDASQWLSWSLFLLTPAAACIGSCQQSRVD